MSQIETRRAIYLVTSPPGLKNIVRCETFNILCDLVYYYIHDIVIARVA